MTLVLCGCEGGWLCPQRAEPSRERAPGLVESALVLYNHLQANLNVLNFNKSGFQDSLLL